MLKEYISVVQNIGIDRRIGAMSYGFINDVTTANLVKATESLTAAQAKLVLSYTGLTKNEIEHVINQKLEIGNNAELAASNEALTASMIQEEAALHGIQISEDGEIMTELVLLQANDNLSASSIRYALALEGATQEQIKATMAGLGLEKQNKKTASSFGLLVKSIKEKITNPYVVLVGGLIAIVAAAKKAKTAIEDVRNEISESGSSFANDKADIDNYVKQINEIQEKLKDQNISVEESVSLRKQLAGIQEELFKKYGDEADYIESITTALTEEAEALQTIADLKWNDTKRKLKEGNSFWENLWENNTFDKDKRYSSDWDRMVSEMFDYKSSITLNSAKFSKKELQQLTSYMEEKGWTRSINSRTNAFYFSKIGDSKELKKEIINIRKELDDVFGSELANKLSDAFTKEYEVLDDIITKYQDYRDEYILREEIYNKSFLLENGEENGDFLKNELLSLKEEYKNFINAETQDISETTLYTLASHLRTIFNNENIPQEVREYIRSLFPTIIAQETKLNQKKNAPNIARNAAYNMLYGESASLLNQQDQESFRLATGFDEKYNAFIEEHKINSEEDLEILNAYIEKYHNLDRAFEEYAKDVKTDSPFLDYANKKDKSKYEGSDYVNDAQSDIKALGDALKQLQEDTMDDSALIDFFQDFPEFQNVTGDLEEAIKRKLVGSIEELEAATGKQLSPELKNSLFNLQSTALQANRTLNETFNTIKSSSGVLKEFKELRKNGGQMNESLLSSIAGLSDELDTMVAGFYGGVVTVEELYDAVEKQREVDFERYKQAYIMKQALDEDYYKNAIIGHKEVVKLFNEQYKIDLKNYTSYQMAKTEVQKKILGKQMSMISLYFDLESMQYTEMYTKLENDAKMSVGHAYSEYTNVRSLIEQYKKAIDDLNQIGWTDFLDEIDKMGLGNFDKILGSTKDYDELFDFFERRIELIDQALNKLDASLEEVNGSMSKNILIAGKIGIVQEEIKDYTNALSMYEQKASAELAKLPIDLQDKIKNGAVSITRLMGENGEEVNKVLSEYKNWADKVNDCNQKLIELKETLRDLALDKFNNIVQDYTDQFDIVGMSNELIEKQISLFEEAGQLVGKAFYESQIATAQKQKEVLEKEKAALIQELTSDLSSGLIQKGTDEWLEMVKGIQEVDSSILDVDQSVEQLQNSLLELNDKVFERLQNTFSDINSQLSNIVGMISDVDVSDEKGVWSKEGLTQLGAYAQQYELARHNVEKYEEEIDKLNQAYNNGLYSTTEYLDKLSELAEAQWEQANSAEDAKKSILELNKARVELIKEGIQKQIDAYKELIDKQKEALDQEKSIRDYEKTIAEKNKNINKLQNQINLLRNDDSAAANAKRIKLEQELADAREDLEETQYDHSIEAQKEALDKQMEDFEDARQKEIDELEAYLKEVEKVQADSFEIIKQNTDVIAGEIENIAKTHGVIISETITNSWAKGEGAIASYGTALSSASSGFIQQIQAIEIYLVALQDEADLTADRLVGMLSAKADNLIVEFNVARDSEKELINATNLLNEALIKTLEGGYDISGIIGALKDIQDEAEKTRQKIDGAIDDGNGKDKTKNQQVTTNSSSGFISSTTQNIGNAVSNIGSGVADILDSVDPVREMQALKQKELDALSFDYYYYWKPKTHEYTNEYKKLSDAVRSGDSNAAKVKYNVDNAVASYLAHEKEILEKYAGFATGVHNLSKSQFAWTQEDGHELVLSPTRNAMFTKLNKGDTVLTKEQTDNLFKLSKIDPESIFGNLRVQDYSKSATPVLSIGNIVTVNGNVDDTNIKKIEAVANSAVTKAFKKFSDEIIKR